MAATSLSAASLGSSLSSPALQTLRTYRFPIPFHSLPHSHRLVASRSFHSQSPLSRRFSRTVRSEFTNGADPPRKYDFDLFTIGAGSGGVRASRFAANFGASVAICELPFATISSDTTGGVGGTCVLRGCVPKKLLVYASKFSHEFEESGGFGWNYKAEPEHDWSTLIANKNAELLRLTGIYKNILQNAGVKLIEGRGKIVDPHTVDVDGKLYSAKNILVSVGGRPFIPDISGSEHAIDSDAALDLPSKPTKIAIVGGGYIAVEFAGVFNGLKSDVHVFIRQKKVLRGFDEEIRDFVGEQMSLRGVKFYPEESPQSIVKSSDGLLSLKTNKGTVEGFSHVMFATGRRPNTKNLGLEAVGVKLSNKGAIEVDEYSQTSVPSIWAIGDVTDRINLTPVALMEGGALAKTLFANEPTKPDHREVPSAVFSQPPIGQVGLTEEQAAKEYGDIDVYTSNFRPLKATVSGLPDRVFMKLIVCAKTNKVLGLHMCGEDSPEIVQGFAVAVKAGLTKADFDATVGIHPTAAEELVTMRTPTRKIRSAPADFDSKDGSAAVSDSGISDGDALRVKEWEVGMLQSEVASSQGIRIRRRPPSGPPRHYVGPFEFRLQNEGNTPCNILEEIVWNKDAEVSKMKEKKPLLTLKKMLDKAPPVRDFVGSLKAAHSRTGLPGLIAEVKKASPSRGVLRDDFDPVQIAKAYEKGGAACLSVLTDEKYFQGSFENLEAIRSSGVQCPLLCKEFVIDAWQIYYARVKGADAILLIAAVLPDLDIKYMIKICKLLGLTALIEVHDEREMDRVLEIEGIELVGINNRNLGTFNVDIGNTKKLLEGERGQRIREKGITVVGESGLFTPADIAYVQEAGVKAVLVGESIVKQTDPSMGITQLLGKDISS